MPARVSAWSVYRLFETKDGQSVFIGLISDKHWQSFCKTFGRPDWLEDQRLATNNGRIEQREWFIPQVEELIRGYTKEEVIRLCDQAGICFSPVARPEDLFEDPQLNQETGGLLDTTFPNGVQTKMPRLPLRMGEHDFRLRSDPAPRVGLDTARVLGQLGYGEDEIRRLARDQVIHTGEED